MLARVCRYSLPPLLLIAGLLAFRVTMATSTPSPVQAARETPWAIASRYNDPAVIGDPQLLAVLKKMQPPAKADTNKWIHALRLWGVNAHFADAKVPSGQTLRDYFLSDRVFRSLTSENTPPLFVIDHDGLRARPFDNDGKNNRTASHHEADLLATFGEIGLPLDTVISMRSGQATVRELLNDSMRRFHLDQHEFEWSIIGYARYLFPQPGWQNEHGQRITLDDLVDELVSGKYGVGPCNGLHRFEAIVVLLRADEQQPTLSPAAKQKLHAYMQQASQLLSLSQADEGYWNRRWPEGDAAATDASSPVYDRILVTGHHLEWLALAPEEVQPPRENIIRAARWLAHTIQEMDAKAIDDHYGPYSHSVRALSLWRGAEAFESLERIEKSTPLAK